MISWSALRVALFGRPLALPSALLARHPILGEASWRRGGMPPRVGGWALRQSSVLGIAVGRTVFLAPDAPLDPALLLHELAHVHQFQQERAFVIRYAWQSLRHGYWSNRYELEANAFASQCLAPTRQHDPSVAVLSLAPPL